jgi:hypothetical protein
MPSTGSHRQSLCRPLRRRPGRCRPQHRRGYALVIFALLFFCLMALGALVIDLGLARLTQRQMQSAVDSAALEGLRGRDRTYAGGEDADEERRKAARNMVWKIFDDDLDEFPVLDDARNFGAGPRINFSSGIALSDDFRASEFFELADPPVYDPQLRLNLDDVETGDMVAGSLIADAPPDQHPSYSRSDFLAGEGDDAFLVRLRRTDEAVDELVRSSGGPVPYLFGRGSLLNVDLRGRGIAVRATAIAHARRAMTIGRRTSDAPTTIAGSLPFFLNATQLTDFTTGTELTVNGSTIEADGQPVGMLYDSTIEDGLGQVWSVGDVALSPSPGITASDIHAAAAQRTEDETALRFGYVPIVGDVSGSPDQHVIGFVAIEFSIDPMNSTLDYVRLADFVAPDNASPVLVHPLPGVFVGPMPPANVDDLLGAQSIIPENLRLLAPALVR